MFGIGDATGFEAFSITCSPHVAELIGEVPGVETVFEDDESVTVGFPR